MEIKLAFDYAVASKSDTSLEYLTLRTSSLFPCTKSAVFVGKCIQRINRNCIVEISNCSLMIF